MGLKPDDPTGNSSVENVFAVGVKAFRCIQIAFCVVTIANANFGGIQRASMIHGL